VLVNHDYTITCVDGNGRELVFRDLTGLDIELLDSLLQDGKTFSPESVVRILDLLKVSSTPERISQLTPRVIRSLYYKVSEHILINYLNKESWLRQCYSIQNGSFQNVLEMERVPMSKFAAMCMIHKEAIDQMNNEQPDGTTDTSTEV
jgi:hypothetical protein